MGKQKTNNGVNSGQTGYRSEEFEKQLSEWEQEPTDEAGAPAVRESRQQQAAAEEAASWAEGGNKVNEGGVVCDLDKESIRDLREKLDFHPEYTECNRGGKPRERLLDVLERKRREQAGSLTPEQLLAKLEAMSAKEYVEQQYREIGLNTAHMQGFGAAQVMEALKRMNRDVAVIKIGNEVRYLVKGTDTEGRQEYRFLRGKDFQQLYANVVVPRMAAYEAGLVPAKGSHVKLAALWDSWQGRRELEGIGFFPGSDKHPAKVPPGYLNLWSGLAITPKQGDWSLFRAHLREKVCRGNQEHFDFLMDWLAHCVQKPQEKPGSAVVLKSVQKGSGKSMLLKFLRKIFGRHLYTAARPSQLTGQFNGHLEDALIFGVEEGLWAGNPAANSVLKDLITGEHIAIERKGLDSKNSPNFTRFIFLSNEGWVVPAGTDERRYFVLNFEHEKAKDQTYFDPIFKQMEDEGGIEAMLHELTEREIKANLRNPPVTQGLLEQRVHGLSASDRFLLDLAKDGQIVVTGSDSKITLDRHKRTLVGKAIVWDVARQYADRYEAKSLQTSLGMRLTALGVPVLEKRSEAHRRLFDFPRLPDFQLLVSKLLGVEIDVIDDGVAHDDISDKPYRVAAVPKGSKKASARRSMERPTLN